MPIENLEHFQIEKEPHQCIKIGKEMGDEVQKEITQALFDNADLCEWSASDMSGIDPDFIFHKLAIFPRDKPIAQRKRKLRDERRKTIEVETEKLLVVKFIREVDHKTWLTNVIVVKKATKKCRMCVDYIDLNKACPKDAYPLPRASIGLSMKLVALGCSTFWMPTLSITKLRCTHPIKRIQHSSLKLPIIATKSCLSAQRMQEQPTRDSWTNFLRRRST